MKAIISTTYDHKYLWFLPLVTWCWNKIGVDVICFVPDSDFMGSEALNQVPAQIMRDSLVKYNLRCELHYFKSTKNKEATYAQISRLYGSSIVKEEGEVLVVSDVDMAVLNKGFIKPPVNGYFDIYGEDLVPGGQLPMCYAVGTSRLWEQHFTKGRNLQECLDDELGEVEAEHFRGNFWSRDQELLKRYIGNNYVSHSRSNGQNQFAMHRLDRDDAYILDRLSPDIIDFHLPRPGFEEKNFNIILTCLKYFYPEENFDWLIEYNTKYKELL